MKNLFILILILAVGGGLYYVYNEKSAAVSTTRLRIETLRHGTLLSTVNATGTLEPEEVVNVGAQVAGLIVAFGEDKNSPSKHVDYCSEVEQDAVLARIDPTIYEARLEQAEAALESSKANIEQLDAKLESAENDWKRSEALIKTNAITPQEYDQSKANLASAKANLKAGKAAVRQNEAMVHTAKIDLGYCTIKSPVKGKIIERRVNIGQTVVASLNAPSLFLIAKDLTKMQVWTSVNEADIGRIKVGMNARFTVDAYENETFTGTVTQIRMNAKMTQNVVTYTVVVTTDNPDGKLLPYLTANVNFEVSKKENVLLVSGAALRWSPDITQISSAADASELDKKFDEGKGRIWAATADGKVKPLEVDTGITDGIVTEISGSGVDAGLHIVTGESETEEISGKADGGTEARNPFLPKLPKGSRPPPGPM